MQVSAAAGLCFPTAIGALPGAIGGAAIGIVGGAGSVLVPAVINDFKDMVNQLNGN